MLYQAEYPSARLKTAIAEAKKYSLLARTLGTGFNFELKIKEGAALCL